MQIELIGCTSAGKSTLKNRIVGACMERQLDIWSDKDFVLKQFGLNWIRIELLRTMLVDLAALIACLVTMKRNLPFHRFTMRTLGQLPLPAIDKFYILRNVLRKLGKYEIIQFYDAGEHIILVDEGVLQIAHNLFVHTSGPVAEAEDFDIVSTFAALVPQPEAIIYLRQPAPLLIDRIVKRGHKRITDPTHKNIARFVNQAVSTFDQLAQHPAIKPKMLVVTNGQAVIHPESYEPESRMGLISQILRDCIDGEMGAKAIRTDGRNGYFERADASPTIVSNGRPGNQAA